MTPLRFLLVCFAGWMNYRQQLVIEYLQEENPDDDAANGIIHFSLYCPAIIARRFPTASP